MGNYYNIGIHEATTLNHETSIAKSEIGSYNGQIDSK
jgi:hypothetical protein